MFINFHLSYCKANLLHIKNIKKTDNVSEWLRRRPAKALCFARAGSNPAVVVNNAPVVKWWDCLNKI